MADEQAKPFPTPTEPGFYWAVQATHNGRPFGSMQSPVPRVVEIYATFATGTLDVSGHFPISDYRFLSGPLSPSGDTPELSLETLAGLHGQIRRLVEQRNEARSELSKLSACVAREVQAAATFKADRDKALAEVKVLKADRDALSTQVADLERRLAYCTVDRNRALRYRDELYEELRVARELKANAESAVQSAPSDLVVRVAYHGYRIDIHKQWIDQLGLRVRAIEDLLKVTPK